MILTELFSQKSDLSVSYKPVYAEDLKITDEELQKLTFEFLKKKAASINSENYRAAVIAEPVYKIPSYIELYDALLIHLKTVLGWDIDEFNDLPIKKVCAYFSSDQDFDLFEDDYSKDKGLLLYGPIGCGKTTLLKVLQKNSFNPFTVISCRKVASDYAEFGHSAITTYSTLKDVSKRDYFGNSTISFCFDDLGTESEKKNFGNQVNVMSEIILNRYDNIMQKNKTFITTNLTPDEIRSYYGDRAVSRMREMFNVIEFPFDGPDRRK